MGRLPTVPAQTTFADGDQFYFVDVDDTGDHATGTSQHIVGSDMSSQVLGRNAVAQTVSGSTDTLAAGDLRRLTLYSNVTPTTTVTVPTGTFASGDWFLLQSTAAGNLTLSTAGITLNGTAPSVGCVINEALYIEFTAANTISVIGGTV